MFWSLFVGPLCTKDGASPSQDEWLRQFDVSLPGCTLKKQVDILALIKKVCHNLPIQKYFFVVEYLS